MSNTRIGLIRCEHCNRQFNPHSGARHIPWCAKQKSEQRKHRLTADKKQALERYKWRISYRPSNQISVSSLPKTTNNADKRSIKSDSSEPADNRAGSSRLKKSSLNSISLSSSHSASSSNSIGTNSLVSANGRRLINTNNNNVGPLNHRQANQAGPSQHLKRSVSSLTLTKQRGLINNHDNNSNNNNNNDDQSFHRRIVQMKERAKSHSDLLNVSEIVETLAKKMDEIFAQNQILLASMSKRRQLSLSTSQSNIQSDNENDESRSIDSADCILCHHCKSDCLESANYCHKCGCKLVRSSTTFSASPTGG